MDNLTLQQRHDHLAMLGVTQWYSRTQLVGALATPESILASPPDVVSGDALNASSNESDHKSLLSQLRQAEPIPVSETFASVPQKYTPSEQPGLSAKSAALKSDLISKKGEEQVVDSMASAQPRFSISPLQAFSVNCYAASGVVVISESTDVLARHDEHMLLQNIFRACRGLQESGSGLVFSQSFSWPVFESLNLQSKQELDVSEVFASWLKSVTASPELVLYFGGQSEMVALAVKAYYSSARVSVFSYSLQEMLQIPVRKFELWQQLRSERLL